MSNNFALITGTSSFPYEISAANEKYRLLAKSLISADFDVNIIAKVGNVNENKQETDYNGTFDNIKFIYTSKRVKKPKSILSRQIFFLQGLINEFKLIWNNRKKNITILLPLSPFPLIIYYFILSIFFKIKVVLNIMEWHVVQKNRTTFQKVNDYLFDNIATRLFNHSIVISHYIEEKIKQLNSSAKTFILPALTDLNNFKFSIDKSTNNYFVYCGHIGYFNVIEFVLQSFEIFSKQNSEINLYLIINGNSSNFTKLKKLIKSLELTNRVIIKNRIPRSQLIEDYQNALALLIPLRETDQDKARFPQKIAEYAASKRPIVTNFWGEIKYYFQDNISAFICNSYNINEYANKMLYIANNKKETNSVGEMSYKVAFNSFHYENYSSKLKQFILD